MECAQLAGAFEWSPVHPKREQAPRTPNASRSSVAPLLLCAFALSQSGGFKGLDPVGKWREITNVHTVTTDKYKRVRLPDAKPQQVFAYANAGDGSITLTPVKAGRKERFPRGSLLKYFTPERNKAELERLSGCS